ncbi:MAG: sialidase family protein [Candidatus Hydrogenedentota bacterium]
MAEQRSTFPVTAMAIVGGLGLAWAWAGQATASEWDLRHTEYEEVLFSDDHVSEGFLAPLDNGEIMLIFRMDPGIEGSHVGTDGYIARIIYDPETDQWGEVETVYNSHEFDDRNLHGGVTREGRIVAFFRQYDGQTTHGRYFIYSDDNGRTWSEPQVSEAWSDPEASGISGVWSTGRMFYNPDIERYMMLGCQGYVTCSRDGAQWEEYNLVTEPRHGQEMAGAWCGDNRMVALIRDDEREHGHPLLQVASRDNGETWSEPKPTNIPPDNHWGCAPALIYDEKRELLIALNSDRYSRPDSENSLFIYTARPDEIMDDPQNWTLQYELPRPWAKENFAKDRPLNQNLYGYPTIAPINENEYLVVFTERARMHGAEQADLYYFRLRFE